ncbi:MAG TPA: chalcone isomerase family protein [Thermoanaerobaculia bacterium]|nr:chalcone isomerase family protein [Thermoanaerobaculia bacterium]
MKKSALALLFALALQSPSFGATLNGVTLADTSNAGGQDLVLNGIALRTKLFFKIYVGGLYLPAKEKDAAKILATDGPRQMVMHWIYEVSKAKSCEVWEEGLEANTPNPSPEVKQGFASLCSWMIDTKEGDRFVFTYVPGTGTTVEVKGERKGVVAGKAFADALFAVWLGPKPSAGGDFKKAILGG